MKPEDLQYLRAELGRAQQQGDKTIIIRTPELQSLINRLDRAIAAAPPGIKIFGFVRPDAAKAFRSGEISNLKTNRSVTTYYTQPVFIGVEE